jgi:hypothetical protein
MMRPMLRNEGRAILVVFTACALPRLIAAAAAGEPFQYLGTCEYASLVPRYDTDVLIGPTYERLRPLLAAHPPEFVPRAADTLLAQEALACATTDPLRAGRMGLQRAILTFSPRLMPYESRGPESKAVEVNGRLELRSMLPRPTWIATIHAASTGLLIVAGVYGFVQRTSRRNAILLLTIASFVIVNGVFMLSTRLTSPMYVVLMCYAGAAAARERTPHNA